MTINKSQKTVKKQRKIHPNSLANLHPFTGGPDPRRNMQGPVPQDQKELNELIDEILAEETKSGKSRSSKLRDMLNRLIKNTPGAIHLLDRRYGKVKESIDLSNSDGSLKPEQLTPSEILARADALRKQVKDDSNGS